MCIFLGILLYMCGFLHQGDFSGYVNESEVSTGFRFVQIVGDFREYGVYL